LTEKSKIQILKDLLFLKVKFAGSSLVATIADYGLYLTLVNNIFNPVISNIISSGTGMIINFGLQKKYIFRLNRKVSHAFLMSVAVSVGGIALGTLFIYLLNLYPFFSKYQYITKLIVTGTIFFYNFYLKRFSFERKFL